MEIFSLRVKKTKAGTKFPFDRVYLVQHANKAVLSRLFRYALVMPVDDHIRGRLKEVVPDAYINRTFDRNDEELDPLPPSTADWGQMLDDGDWVLAVPILTKFVKKAIPRYLVAAGWYAEQSKVVGKVVTKTKRAEPFPTMTYLQTPEKNIRPVCVMCPRFILHQNGECKLGDSICFTSIALGMKNYFEDGANAEEPPPSIKDSEIKEFQNGLIQKDDSRES